MILKTRFFLIASFLLFVSFFILLFVFPVGGAIDLYLIQPWVGTFGDFALKGDWYLATLNHSYAKKVLTFVYVSFFLLWIASFKIEKLKVKRWQYGYMFWVSMLCTCTIGLIKAQAAHACPWDMTHKTLTGFVWDFSATAGHCFPGGHASTGFALVTGYFVYRLDQRKRAWFYLFSGVLIGFVMGWTQMMRGAHFLSHNLWTAWICFAINTVVYMITYKHHLGNDRANSVTQMNPDMIK